MVIWGAIFGGLLGLMWPGHDWEFQGFMGAILGLIAGLFLRRAVRSEIKAALAKQALVPAAPVAAAPSKRRPEDAFDEPEVAAGQAETPLPQAARVTPPAATEIPAQAMPDAAPALATSAEAVAAAPLPPKLPPAPAQPDIVTVLFGKAKDWLFGGNTVVRMGVLVLFVGLAFLAKYAIDNALFPPELRLAAIAAFGIGLFVAGIRLRNRAADKLAYALTLQGAGVAVLYLTVFAAFRLYQFLPAGAAFAALGLVCAFSAVIAIAQNSMAMAFIGFAGGFAAPILVSTGQGNHVGLFTYYLLLGVVIAAMAWVKAWRALNLLGFFATFGVATVWGVLKYKPENFSTTEPFLIAFFLVYLVAALLYALRHSLGAKRAVDGTLIFGTPLVAFALQAALVRDFEYAAAFSSLALGALYLALGWWMAKPGAGRTEVHRWLAECFAALGLGFVTLAVPLALDSRWTSAVWAVEGAAVFWLGRRQGRWLARAAGLALQALAAIAFLEAHRRGNVSPWPLANPAFIGGTLLAASAFGIAWWSREPAESSGTRFDRAFANIESGLSPLLFWLGFFWWQFALYSEVDRMTVDVQGVANYVFDEAGRLHLKMIAWVASAYVLHHLALPQRKNPWAIAATPVYTVLPVMIATAFVGVATLNHVFQSGGWAAWPLVLMLHVVMLRRLDAGPPQPWWTAVHTAGVWLMVLLAGNLLVFAVGQAKLWQTAWASVILLVSGIAVLLVLSRRRWFEIAREGGPWPLERFGRAYLWFAAAPLAVAVALGCLVVAVYSNGNAKPLPYVPLLNPTDLAIGLGLAACALWLMRIRESDIEVPPGARDTRWQLALAAIGFIAINTVWLRVVHHYGGIPWSGRQLFESFLVQAGFSILWTLIALGLMIGSHRRALRGAWMLGAGLLGITVLKLFVVDLSNRGGSERIFVFIAVGILMLVVGYFAPLPPANRAKLDEPLQGAQS